MLATGIYTDELVEELTPNACWLLKIRCVTRRIFARCEYGTDLAYGPGVVLA